jgi:Sulfotransferase family
MTMPVAGRPEVPPIVFLHIPKTAGQTIHSELARVVGRSHVSPIRVHTQPPPGPGQAAAQLPPGYRLYSGHLDWTALDSLPGDRFVFTVLRDPWERIASFYFYLLDQAQNLPAAALQDPGRLGLQMILTRSADDYFFGGDAPWQQFILDHYDNFYCSYFATQKMRGQKEIAALSGPDRISRALEKSRQIDRIYGTHDLTPLQTDILDLLRCKIHVTEKYINTGPQERSTLRWPVLLDRLERDSTAARLSAFASLDRDLMTRLDLP